MDAKFHGRMLLAEANQWPEDAVAYFGKGDESHMVLYFAWVPRMFMALQMEERSIIDTLDRHRRSGELPVAMFLRNHDELTLEMVTDEERDYGVSRLRERSVGADLEFVGVSLCSRTVGARSSC